MRTCLYKTWILAAALALMPWVGHAAGLGKLSVLSALGQPLSAEIDLIAVTKDELSTLSARLASPEAFQQANIQYSPALVGIRFSIEKRADGQPYIKIISTRPVNDPFIDLLVEVNWGAGRLLREYTALIDPPEYGKPPEPAAPVVVVSPTVPETRPVTPAPAPVVQPLAGVAAPAEEKPVAKAPAAAPVRPAAAPARAAAREYGPVRRGETLAKIAASVKPEGVTLEQTLVSLYRNNADAFVGNMNRLKTGKILRVPEKERIVETAATDAVKEVRVQAANWNVYRQKLAEAAGKTLAQESKPAASGKITTAVEDKAAGKAQPKEVLRLSKSEPAAAKAGKGAPRSSAERMRALEEEAVAREKALSEANARIAQLEKTIKDMQRLLEVKGQVPGAKPPAAKPAAVPPAKPEVAAKAEPPKAPAPAEAPKAEPKAAPVEKPAVVEPPKAEAPKPQPKPKIVAPPPPEPGLVDQILDEPLYLAGAGLLVILLGGGGYWFMRRRAQDREEGGAEKTTTKPGKLAVPVATVATPTAMPAAGDIEDVDPLQEADLYLSFGRDAQAEAVLKDELAKNPKREEVQLKLLEIYAARKDKAQFDQIAKNLHAQTGGSGDNWLKTAAMGYALSPETALYEAGKSAPVPAAVLGGAAPSATELDFDLDLTTPPTVTKADVELEAAGPAPGTKTGDQLDLSTGRQAMEQTMVLQPAEVPRAMEKAPAEYAAERATATVVEHLAPDLTLPAPAATGTEAKPDIAIESPAGEPAKTDIALDAGAPLGNVIDFNFELPGTTDTEAKTEAGKGAAHDITAVTSPEEQEKAAGLVMDFDLGESAKPATPVAAETPPAAEQPPTTVELKAPALEPDFKLDLGGDVTAAPAVPEIKLDDIDLNINLNLDEVPKVEAPSLEGGPKDDRWYDVQTKFDLAKAYQEMGDKDGAREILQEVIKEGDAGQQAEAKQLLESLG